MRVTKERIEMIMKTMKDSVVLGIIAAALMVGTGCKKEGPAEKAGKNLDKAVETSKDKVKEGVEKAGEAAEKAGDKVKDATK